MSFAHSGGDPTETLLDLVEVMLVALDVHGRVTMVNRKAEAILGCNEQAIIGKSWFGTFVPEENRARVAGVFEQLMAGEIEAVEYFENGILTASGEPRLIAWHNTILRDNEGRPTGTLSAGEDVTERRLAERIVNEQNDFLSSILESLTHPFYVIDVASHRVVMANTAAFDALPPDATCYSLTHGMDAPCDEADHPCPLNQVVRTRRPVRVEHVHRDAAGGRQLLDIHGYPVLGPDGSVVQMIEYAIDVTARHAAEESLSRRNRELTLLNRVMAAASSEAGPEAVLEVACRELAQTFGLPHATAALLAEDGATAGVVAEYAAGDQESALGNQIQVAGNPAFEHVVEQRVPLLSEDVRDDPRLAAVSDALRRRGSVSMMIVPLVVEGRVVGSIGLDDFRSRRFTAEEVELATSVGGQAGLAVSRARLTESRRRLQAALEQSAEGVVITDLEGVMVYVNPAFERITGYTASEAVGQNIRILNSGRQDSELSEEMWSTIKAGKAWHGRMVNRRKDGGLYTEDVSITPIRDDSGAVVSYLRLKRDVTGEVELETRYRQAQKMESVGRLAGGLAHDFNNLLAAILGYSDLAARTLSPSHPAHGDLVEIQETAERAANLTRQLLTFARRHPLAPEVLNLSDLILDLDSMLRRLIGEDVELVTLPDSDLWPVRVDRGLVEQLVVNLVVNARDAMPEGGKLKIQTSTVVLATRWVDRLVEIPPGEYVLLEVSDTGVGMSEEVMIHAFEPFFTTKEAGKGTGLGLATCFGTVSQHDGFITVQSEERFGSTFRVFLPRCHDAETSAVDPREPSQLPTGSETILVVEDEPAMRQLAATVLKRQGYRVLVATNGEEALRVVEQAAGTVDLLLTDIVMPRMGGSELAERLMRDLPELRVILMSGYSPDGMQRQGPRQPGTSFLAKPFSPKRLAQMVREVLDGSAG